MTKSLLEQIKKTIDDMCIPEYTYERINENEEMIHESDCSVLGIYDNSGDFYVKLSTESITPQNILTVGQRTKMEVLEIRANQDKTLTLHLRDMRPEGK
jgi:hypothetical protein